MCTPALDAACVRHDRDPATLQRTIAVRVTPLGDTVVGGVEPLTGAPEQIADAIREYARSGVSHMQIWLVPNDVRGVEAFAPVLEELDRG
jgi:hypothetical protein